MDKLIETALIVFNEVTKRKEIVVGIGLIILVYLGFLLGKSSCKECSKEVVCKSYIQDNTILESQLNDCQENCLTKKVDIIKKCQIEEANACKAKIEKYKKVYVDLKCSICNKKEKK